MNKYLPRSRTPDSNRAERKADRLPHGYAGAKLGRKAAAGKLGKCHG